MMVVTLTHFIALVSFLTPDNIGFNGGIEIDQWHKMGPMTYFYTPWKRQKTFGFRGSRNGTSAWKTLIVIMIEVLVTPSTILY